MKFLKILVVAIVMVTAYSSARAQVIVRAGVHVGGPVYHHRHRHYYRPRERAVVVVGTAHNYYYQNRWYAHRREAWRQHHRYYTYY